MDGGMIRVQDAPRELHRGIHMIAVRRGCTVRQVLIATLYEVLDRELADWPEWRYQTKPGDERTMFQDGRKAAGLKRRKKKEPDPKI